MSIQTILIVWGDLITKKVRRKKRRKINVKIVRRNTSTIIKIKKGSVKMQTSIKLFYLRIRYLEAPVNTENQELVSLRKFKKNLPFRNLWNISWAYWKKKTLSNFLHGQSLIILLPDIRQLSRNLWISVQ